MGLPATRHESISRKAAFSAEGLFLGPSFDQNGSSIAVCMSMISSAVFEVMWGRSPTCPAWVSNGMLRHDGCVIVSGLVAGFPLDIAAEARPLLGAGRPSREYRVDGGPQVRTGYRLPIARPALIELPPIRQLPAGIEYEEIRRARGVVALSHRLAFVIQHGEVQAPFRGHPFQPVGRI